MSDVQCTLYTKLPLAMRLYTVAGVIYPMMAYAYWIKYDEWLGGPEWTFLLVLVPTTLHVLLILSTVWSMAFRVALDCITADLSTATFVRVIPALYRGKQELVPLTKRRTKDAIQYSFVYQRDTFIYDVAQKHFVPLAYPVNSGITTQQALDSQPLSKTEVQERQRAYGQNTFDIPAPAFAELFVEHATAPFFVFQVFCVALWCLDDYWYYSLFTLFMLVVFEATVCFQRLKTLSEFRAMSVKPYDVRVQRRISGTPVVKWSTINSQDLVPGDIVQIQRTAENSAMVADVLLLSGTAVVDEAMLSGESTPLLKESIRAKELHHKLDFTDGGPDRAAVVYGGTKVLQVRKNEGDGQEEIMGLVLRTGFGTQQGQLVRTMLFSTERVSANNLESFLFIGFLLVFAIAASTYVWIHGSARGLKKKKLILDCILIITSVVPPELPMELSMAVNASLANLSRIAIFCTEPFRLPLAGNIDICCFDKTGTITGENLVVQGIADCENSLAPIEQSKLTTKLCLAAAHALVQLDDGTIVGDSMERATLESLGWKVETGDRIVSPAGELAVNITIKKRFQFTSALKRMSSISVISTDSSKHFVAVKGAPEVLRDMYTKRPDAYDETYKAFTRNGSRVLALGYKYATMDRIDTCERHTVESDLHFVGFLVFHCPLKEDAVETIKMLNASSHRCIMITGDNPLTAIHVAQEVEITDRKVLILDLVGDNLSWSSNVGDVVIPQISPHIPDEVKEYDLCVTGPALRQYQAIGGNLDILVQCVWVYSRVSPAQKELILTRLKEIGYITLMAGDGTNDVGALKQAHVGVALLQGTAEDLQKIAAHQRTQQLKSMYETQLKLMARFNQPPPPVPPALVDLYPELVETQKNAVTKLQIDRSKSTSTTPPGFDLSAMMSKMQALDDGEAPQIKLGDASCAAPFTSKLSNLSAITSIIRQGRCTLVATIQMYKILALNCLITAYSLSVQYLDGIKFGDYQVTITGVLMSICFLCISRAKPLEKLSKQRPLPNIFNPYIVISILIQFAIHIASLVYMTNLSKGIESRVVDLDAEFAPSLLNTAIYLLGLSQQVSTFAINYQGRPFRESIRENPGIYWSLLGVSGVAVCGALDIVPEFNKWLQIVDMAWSFRVRLAAIMFVDFAGCWLAEIVCKRFLTSTQVKPIIQRRQGV